MKTHELFPERMGEWLERVKMPVESQYINYWNGPGQEYLPGWHPNAGYYPNSDAMFILVMGLAGKLFEEKKYLDRAHEFVRHLDNCMLIDGGFHYLHSENEIPTYHQLNIASLARYWMVTKDEYALDVIKRSVDYYPLSFGNTGVTERTVFPWYKKMMGHGLDAGNAEIVTAVSGDRRHKYLANKFFNENSTDVIAIDFWRNDIDPVKPEDFHIFKDRNVNGIRGRFGDFSWVTTFGHGACMDAFVGTIVAPSNENSPVKYSAMELVTPEVGVANTTGAHSATNAYVTGREYNRDIIYNDGFCAIAVSYQLFLPWRESLKGHPAQSWTSTNTKTGVPWISNQLWLLLPDNVIGRIVTESMEKQEVEYFRTRIRLAPFDAIVKTGEKEYTVNNLKLILHNHNLSTPTLNESAQLGFGTDPASRLGKELVLSANKRKFNTGEKFFLSLEARPWIIRPKDKPYFEYVKEYEALPRTFNPVNFNPDKWAKAAKDAGMKYVVFTTKHHDGFCMFDTKYTDYKITSPSCPFSENPKANIAKEIFNSFRKQDFMTGAYFSTTDWHHNDFWWDYFPPFDRRINYSPAKYPEKWERYNRFLYNQLEELSTGYGKVDLFWFDLNCISTEKNVDWQPVSEMLRKNQPGTMMVVRGNRDQYENYRTPEQHLPEEDEKNMPSVISVSSMQPVAGSKVFLLGYNKPLGWQKNGKGFLINVPRQLQNKPVCENAWVFRFRVK